MDEIVDAGPNKPSRVQQFFRDMLRMPAWQKMLFVAAGSLLGLGVVGQVANTAKNEPAPQVSPDQGNPPANTSVNGPKSGFVGSGQTTNVDDKGQPTNSPAADAPSWTWSGFSTRLGGGFIGGFILGWIFRAFLKMMALVTMAGVLLIGSLSYFNVMNVDLTAAKTKYESGVAWVTDQGSKLYHAAKAKLNSTAPAAFGAFLGFRRRS